jgi:hypothetical protein
MRFYTDRGEVKKGRIVDVQVDSSNIGGETADTT